MATEKATARRQKESVAEAPAETTAVTTQGTQALARPSFIKEGDTRGTENIGAGDIRPPALKIAQSTSPETKRHEPAKYIEGLREGDFFNTSTREIYGEGPINLVIINQLGHRNVEFEKGDSNVILDFNVPDGDPRTQFTEEVVDGKKVRVKPRATLFYDYLIYVLPEGVDGPRIMATMSMKSTQLRKARDLNMTLKGSKMPSFAFLFEVKSVPEKRGANSFYGWLITPKGYVSEEIYNDASKVYDDMLGKTINMEEATDNSDEAAAPSDDSKVPF